MNKKIKFLISLALTAALLFGALCMPAASFSNDVETSTNDMLLINLDTHTTVFAKKPDNMWYAGSLAELTTFLVANELIENPDERSVKIEKSFIDALPHSDGCLDDFVGKTLTARDLMAIMLLTSGSDAAYALADLAAESREDFVKLMNDKVKDLGCKDTGYVSPGFDNTSDQYTTCRDLYRIYTEVLKSKFYNTLMEENSYTPDGLDDDVAVTSEASILNEKSPYYFKYTNGAKYSYSEETYAGIVLTTTYRGMTYFYAGLLGLNESEKNVYADAKKLTTWAYLNLSDRKVIEDDSSLSVVSINTGWGSYDKELYTYNATYKTVPNDFDELLLSYDVKVPEEADWPLFEGQSIGSVTVSYDKEEIDKVDLVVDSDEGVSLLADSARFADYVYQRLMGDSGDTDETTAETTAATTAETEAK